MKKLYIMIGIPGCGKSTYLKENFDDSVSVVSSDAYVEQYAEENGITYNEAFSNSKLIDDINKKFIHIDFKTAIAAEKDIVIDRTNLSRKSRKQWISAAKKAGYECHAIALAHPGCTKQDHVIAVKEWSKRLASRPGKTIPQRVLNSMLDAYQLPIADEGFDNITFIDNF